jgi:hypothetical protein
MTNVPSRTRPVTRPGPPHAMGIRGCHGCMVSAVSRGTVVGPTQRVGPRDATGPKGRPACGASVARGGLAARARRAGGFGKKLGGKEISRDRRHVSHDRP